MALVLPNFGDIVEGQGGRLGAIIAGPEIKGAKVGYALIFADYNSPCLPWGDFGCDIISASSLVDGYSNTIAMRKSSCMAAKYIKKIPPHFGFSDWYIPSLAECWLLYSSVAELVPPRFYWSSTQESSCYSWVFDFSSGDFFWKPKDKCYSFSAIRRIEINLGSAS